MDQTPFEDTGNEALTLVYILSVHEEHGAEGVRATLDTDKLTSILHDMLLPESVRDHDRAYQQEQFNKSCTTLKNILTTKSKTELLNVGKGYCNVDGSEAWNLIPSGWGGPQLHVVELT